MSIGDAEKPDAPSMSATEPRRPRWRVPALVGLAVFTVAFACWLGYQGIVAKSNLEAARVNAQAAKEALSQGDAAEAAKFVEKTRESAQRARDATHSLPWTVASAVPWLGSPLQTGRQISEVVLGLSVDVLQPSVDVGAAISPERLIDDGGRLDVQLLGEAAPRLSTIAASAAKLDAQAQAIVDPTYLSVIREARTALQAQTADLSGLLSNTSLAARLTPTMMGADGSRSYFMGFQTNAEARGTGGLLGGYAVLRFENGMPRVDKLGSNAELDRTLQPLDLGAEFDAQYGYVQPTTDFRNSNLSSHFPYAARIWKSLWEQQFQTTVDGVVAIDPVALSYILGAVGPVVMSDGETVTKDNVVELTESTAYVRFADDTPARKAYLQDIPAAVVEKMTGRLQSPRQLLDALGKGVGEGRIAVWSGTPDEQQLLEETPLAHVVPDDPAPYAGVVINNLAGNKLDYYLTRQIDYTAGPCDGETRRSTVTVRLTNNVGDQPLPDYVDGGEGLRSLPVGVPKGTNVSSVSLLATANSTLTAAFVDGKKTPFYPGMERGHPLFEIDMPIEPGRTVEMKFELIEPTAPGAARVPVQPLLDAVVPTVSVPQCPG